MVAKSFGANSVMTVPPQTKRTGNSSGATRKLFSFAFWNNFMVFRKLIGSINLGWGHGKYLCSTANFSEWGAQLDNH